MTTCGGWQAEIVKEDELKDFLPDGLKLKKYQLQGLNWLVSMHRIRVRAPVHELAHHI